MGKKLCIKLYSIELQKNVPDKGTYEKIYKTEKSIQWNFNEQTVEYLKQ